MHFILTKYSVEQQRKDGNREYGLDWLNVLLVLQVSRFDVITGEEEILPEMNEARENFTSILVGKYIYVFGGWGQKNYADESIDSEELNFDIDSNSGYSKSCER